MKVPVLRPTTRTITLLATGVALLFCAGILVYTVCSRNLKAAEADLRAKQKQVDDSRRIATRLTAAREAYERAQRELGFLESSVSSYAYVPTLLKQLEQLGRSKNLKVVSVRPQIVQAASAPIKRTSQDIEGGASASSTGGEPKKVEQPKPYEELNIDVVIEGPYWHARDFIYSLTTFPKIIAVKQIQMAPATAVERMGSPQLSIRLNTTAFIFPQKEAENVETKPVSSPPVTTKAAAPNGRAS